MDPGVVVRLVSTIAAVAAITSFGSGSPVTVARPSAVAPSPCAADTAESTWFRLDATLDATGALAGQHLSIGTDRTRLRSLDLPPESFAAAPYDAAVLAGDDDGHRSRLRLLRRDPRCDQDVAVSGDVVRSAVLTPDGTAVVEHHVDRATRADLGIFRRRVPGGELVRVTDPVPWDETYGPTWTTDLVATADGRVVVGSCGQFMCRARVASRDGATRSVDRIGPVIGLLGDDVVAYETCRGLPCGIDAVATDGKRWAISAGAGRARIADGRLVFEDAIRARLVVVDASKRTVDLGPLPADRHLVASTSSALAAGGAGDVLLTPDGRIPADGIDGSVDRLALPPVEQEISR